MLKTTIFVVALYLFATGCSTVRPAASRQPASTTGATTSSSGSVQFIDNISVTPSGRQDKSHSSISTSDAGSGTEANAYSNRPAGPIENYPALQFKYAILENASVEDLNNPKLLSFMDYWYGTPYHYGGSTRDGIDCSAFAILLMSSVYGVATLPRTSKEQYEFTRGSGAANCRKGTWSSFTHWANVAWSPMSGSICAIINLFMHPCPGS
jgi:cell wall-associated NlpC family hydrolase